MTSQRVLLALSLLALPSALNASTFVSYRHTIGVGTRAITVLAPSELKAHKFTTGERLFITVGQFGKTFVISRNRVVFDFYLNRVRFLESNSFDESFKPLNHVTGPAEWLPLSKGSLFVHIRPLACKGTTTKDAKFGEIGASDWHAASKIAMVELSK